MSLNPLVYTIEGLVPRAELDIEDHVEWHENARKVLTIWKRNGVIVRQDAHINFLRPVEMTGEQSRIG